MFLQFSQKSHPLLPFPLVFSFRSLSWYLSCFYVLASSFTNGKKYVFLILFSNTNSRVCHKINLNKKNNTNIPLLFYKELFSFKFPVFFIINHFITLEFPSRIGPKSNSSKIYTCIFYISFWKFYNKCFHNYLFFIYSKGRKTRSQIKSEEPSRKYSGSLPISKWRQFWGNPHLRATSPSNRWNTNGAWTRINNVWRGLVSPVWRASEKSIFH